MKILFDTNVILDVMLLRDPFYKPATQLMVEVENKKIDGYVCSITVTTIHCLVSKVKGVKEAKAHIENILNIFNVASVDKRILELSLHANFTDYEDAVIHEAGLRSNLDGIVTRNRTDFKRSKIPIFDPEELVKILRSAVL
jgi:predicted nucleic acid-binding protein